MNIVLQVGQCGNQLGTQFFGALADVLNHKKTPPNFSEEGKQRFFSDDDAGGQMYPRTVLVDTEPKVIQQMLLSAKKRSSPYRENCFYIQKKGAANNWAMGYFEHGGLARESVMDLLHKESERCDILEGFHVFMSVAGGTGSGLGTYLTEVLNDEYPSVPIMNHVVWPFKRGEVTVQAHNAMLTLSHLQSASDAILLLENDQLYSICSQKLGLKDISLSDLNAVACSQLLCLLLPAKSSSGFSYLFGDILSHLVAHPQYKLLNLRCVPQEPPECRHYSSYAWQSLLRILRRMVLYSSVVDDCTQRNKVPAPSFQDACVSIANLLVLRGMDSDSADIEQINRPSLPYASWVPEESRLAVWHSLVQVFEQQKTATLANNGQSVIPCVDMHVAKSWKMYSYKAFLHHYKACGLSPDDFLERFAQVEQIVASYKALTS